MYRLTLIVLFAVALGHLTWHALVGPALADYWVGGHVAALCGPNAEERQLYLRREIFLSQRPRRAWLQVLGRDRLRLYVNGKFLQGQSLPGFPVAVVVDLAPFLVAGHNVIAVAAEQHTLGQPPVVAVEGAYAFDEQEVRIQSDSQWRCRAVFERNSAWWFETDFDYRHWAPATVTSAYLRAKVEEPPRAVTEPRTGKWITMANLREGSAALRREFDLPDRPAEAWLRVTANSSYRLALNGILLDQQEDQLAALVAVPAVQRTYDISRLVRRGHNVLALVLTSTAGHVPRLLVDLEVKDRAGEHTRLGTDNQWPTCPGLPSDWLDMTPNDSSAWQPCSVETGDVLIPPWLPRRQFVALVMPWSVVLREIAGQISLMAVIAVLTWLACNVAARKLASRVGHDRSAHAVYLALVPATVGIAAGVLATYDPRIARQDIYQSKWVLLAAASVLAQWGLFITLCRWRGIFAALASGLLSLVPRPSSLFIVGLVLLGFQIRMRDIVTEGLQWDEVENYHATLGFLERGFPSLKVHDDLPRLLIHTSELQFIPMALAALVFDDAAYIVRFPAVCWSTLTIWLIFHVGRRWFNASAGLLAATLYTLAPVCIAMSNFGRYFNQLQFFVLLTTYFFWLTLRGCGPIDRRALWLTALSFLGLFLTWEASALIAPGMVFAALVQRRGHLRPVLCTPAVWAAMVLVVLVVVIQASHVMLQQTQFLWYGISLSDVKLIPMWRYPIPGVFQPWYYIWQSSWTQDALLPLLGLLGAMALAVRHAWRRPVRFLLIIHLATCLLMAFLLPNTQWRYIHHLVPLPILLSAAVLVAGARWLGRAGTCLSSHLPRPTFPSRYARFVGLLVIVLLAGLASGLTVELREMTSFRVEGHGLKGYKFPNLAGAARYLRDHMQEGDVMLANNVYQIHHLMGITGRPNRPLDFMPATGPFLPGTVDDRRPVLLDRRDGTQMITTPDSMVALFARQRRIWYVVQPGQHYILNTPDVSTYLRQHMEVVYEDWEALVLFRGDKHRPAFLRLENERALSDAQANFLP